MKKITRLCFLFLVLGICLSLCGCDALDDMRASRASLVAEDFIRLSDGTEYKCLPECEELVPDFAKSESIYIVEDDLPVLLTEMFGTYLSKSEDGQFLRKYQKGNPVYYCRADLYDSIYGRIQNGFTPEIYAYTYYDKAMGDYVFYALTPAQVDAVNQVYSTQEPEQLPIVAKLQFDSKVDLYLYSADYLFRQDTVDICQREGKYFVVASENILYRVPEALSQVFAGIMLIEEENDLVPPG